MALAFKAAQAAIPDGTLASCQAFAAKFDNTCENATALTDLAAHAGVVMSCTGTSLRCPGGTGASDFTTGSPCIFSRKLCVTCSETGGVVKIKVQANGLPNHCFNSTVNNAVASENTWEVNWNVDVSSIQNYQTTNIDSEAKTSELLCDLQRTSSANMLTQSGYLLEIQRDGGDGTRPPRDGSGGERTGTR